MLRVLVATLFLAQSSWADGTCAAANPNRTAVLETIKPLTGKQFTLLLPDVSYTISFCSDVAGHLNASVVSVGKNRTTVLGLRTATDVIVDGKLTLVTFAGGDVINSTDRCNNTRHSTVIVVECDAAEEVMHLMDPLNAACSTFFHLTTPAICLLPKSSRWTVFFMLIFTAAICYLLIGMAYRRFVTGAKGMEQIPNYDFWRDPCGYTRDYCNRRDMRRNEWSRTSPMADNVDEPLLHP